MKVQADLFPFQADSIDYHHPLDESGERPNACCPACKGQLTFQDIDHGPDVLVGTVVEPSATAICTACGTLYTLRYVTRSREPVLKRFPVNTRLVSLHPIMDDGEAERVTPPGSIWIVGSIEWDDTGTLDEQRGLDRPATGAGCFATLEELEREFYPIGDLALLAFAHEGMWIELPHKDFGATWNNVDPCECYGFVLVQGDNPNQLSLVRELDGGAGKIVIRPWSPLQPKTPGAYCPITRYNAAGEILAQATLAELEDMVAAKYGRQSPDDALTFAAFRAKYEALGGEHPDHPRKDWAYQVANDDTISGYWEWAFHRVCTPDSI